MQNKPNLLNAQMNINSVLTMDYVNIRLRSRFKNKANQTQFKANSNPFKPNFNPNTPKTNPIKPNQTPGIAVQHITESCEQQQSFSY